MFRLIAVPLYSVTSMVGVVALMEQVRAAELPPGPGEAAVTDLGERTVRQ